MENILYITSPDFRDFLKEQGIKHEVRLNRTILIGFEGETFQLGYDYAQWRENKRAKDTEMYKAAQW